MSKKLDQYGWYLVMLHQFLGHEKTRQIIDGERYDPADCILCQFDKGEATQADVLDRMGR